MKKTLILRWQRTQQGAAAIEFALLFLLFFVLFYAIVSYSLAMLLAQGLTHAAEEGARSAISVDPLGDDYYGSLDAVVRKRVGDELLWLPDKARQIVVGGDNIAVTPETVGTKQLFTVTVRYPGYATNGLIPTLTLPLIGAVPRLPTDLVGQASVKL